MMSSTKPLVVVAAGGTGGHMFPAQAFADEMHEREFRMPRREVECVRQKRAVMQARPLRLTRFVRCLVAYKPL